MVFHPALLTHRQDTCQARLIESERSSVEEEQARKIGFSLSGKELKVRKVGEGKGKTIHVELFGLLSDRFLGLLHDFKLIDSRFRSTTVLYSVHPVIFDMLALPLSSSAHTKVVNKRWRM